MTPERWQQIDKLLQAALERPSTQRAAFLDEACAGDEALRKEVESLIRFQERAGTFMEAPALEGAADWLAREKAESMIGRMIGPYKVLGEIAHGGMGEVYLAQDTELPRKIALKLLPAYFTREEERLRRFQREAWAASGLNHPNIITIYKIGQVEGTHFIAMEFVDGQTLRKHMACTRMKLSDVLDVSVQLAGALAAAHEAGIVHRDIKPENIMVRPDGYVKVLDFGIAKLSEGQVATNDLTAPSGSEQTGPGRVMGTVAYMSPEQARGEKLDGRTDLFSFGAVLYEMATGRPAFSGHTPAIVFNAILEQTPVPPRHLNRELPPRLEEIITKALEKPAKLRYQTAAHLCADLKRLKSEIERGGVAGRVWTSKQVVAVALAFVMMLVPAAYFIRQHLARPPQSLTEKIRLAVLPFDNLSGDEGQEYFSDGLTDQTIAQLGGLYPERLGVIARTSAMRYKRTHKDIQQVAQELNVQYALEGTVFRAADRVRITAQLIQCSDQTHLWAKTFESDLSDILALQNDVARAIAEGIQLKLTPQQKARLGRPRPVNPEAYEAYLKGRFYWNKRTPEDLQRGVQYFEQAIEKDSNYALAYAGLADSYSLLGSIGYDALLPRQVIPQAKKAAVRAVELDDTLPEAHTSLAYVKTAYEWNWAEGEREFRRAIELNPGYATAHEWYAWYLTAMGRSDEAIAEVKLAQELDPFSLVINAAVAQTFNYARQYDHVIEECRKALELDRKFFYTHFWLGRAYEETGRYQKAIEEFQKGKNYSGRSPLLVAAVGHAHALSGNRGEAQKAIDELRDVAKRRYVPALYIAPIYAAMGDKKQALQWLERAFQERSDHLIYLQREQWADPVRSDPRFQDLIRRIGLPRIRALAILPLENLTGDPEEDYFADGMSEELIADLGKVGGLRVASRISVMRYKGVRRPLPQIARELGVDAVVEGTVRRAGAKVRITAKLIEATTDQLLWSGIYEREQRDVLALESDVAQAIVSEVRVKLTTQEHARLTAARSVDPEAYEAYLKGRYYWNKRGGEGLAKAIQYFEQAISKDPNYALPYAGLADSYSLLGSIGIGYEALPPREAEPKAKAAAGKALQIDETLAEAHTSLAYARFAYDWDWPNAEKEFRRAIELDPGYATAHQWYALYLAATGRLDEARAEINRARDIDPLSVPINVTEAQVLIFARQYDQAIEQCRKTFELDPNSVLGHYYLGRAYEEKRMYGEAIAEFEKGRAFAGSSPGMIMALGHALAVSGKKREAQEALAELKVLSRERHVPALYVAAIYTGLADNDQAFRWLEKALDERSDYLVYLKAEPMSDSLRSDPRFERLLRRIGLPR